MDIKKRIECLKLNVKHHQAQIYILIKEIKELEKYKINNSNDNSNNDINNSNSNSNNSNVDIFCFDKVIKLSKKNENLKEFI